MIGKKIKSLIDSSGLKYLDVAKKLDITYQNLNRILNKESVETRYLFEIANILNVPVTAFFEDEPGGKAPAVDVDKLQNENTKLKKRIEELSAQLEDKKMLIDFFKSKARHLLFSDLVFKLFKSENEGFEIELTDEDFERLKEEFGGPDEIKEFIFQNVKVKSIKNS